MRDICRRIGGDAGLDALFKWPLYQAATVLGYKQRQRGRKIWSLHAPEVECIGKGKAHAPYEFGVKVSVATTLKRSKGGQFALHAKALPGNPYDGHTLASIIPDMEKTIGNQISRILADAGYRGHNAPDSHKFRVFTSGQKRRVTPAIKRQMRRRSAIEPVIGHIKAEHRMDRNYLAGKQGDAVNAILAAAGYNFSLILRWLKALLWLLLAALQSQPRDIEA
jgi:IS5 family transposase